MTPTPGVNNRRWLAGYCNQATLCAASLSTGCTIAVQRRAILSDQACGPTVCAKVKIKIKGLFDIAFPIFLALPNAFSQNGFIPNKLFCLAGLLCKGIHLNSWRSRMSYFFSLPL
jgi:hypothetical protein